MACFVGFEVFNSTIKADFVIKGENFLLRRNLPIKAICFRNCFNYPIGLFKAKSNYINLSTKNNQPKALNRRFII